MPSIHIFHEIPDARAVLYRKGVYKQVKVYRRETSLYAAFAGGFIRLYEGGTSMPDVRLDGLSLEAKTRKDAFGRMLLDCEKEDER